MFCSAQKPQNPRDRGKRRLGSATAVGVPTQAFSGQSRWIARCRTCAMTYFRGAGAESQMFCIHVHSSTFNPSDGRRRCWRISLEHYGEGV